MRAQVTEGQWWQHVFFCKFSTLDIFIFCQKNERAGGEETPSETSQYFFVVAIVFPPNFIAMHLGNATDTKWRGGDETGETNLLARGAVWWRFSWWSIMVVRRPERTVDLRGPQGQEQGRRQRERLDKWSASTTEERLMDVPTPRKTDLPAGE